MLTVFIGLILGTKKIKDRETPLAWVTTTGGQRIVEPSGPTGEWPLQSPSVSPTAARLFVGGLRKQEMRDCKGIKVLLGMCPSNHRGEDLLP